MIKFQVGNDICLIRESNHGYMSVHIATVNGNHDVVKALVERCRDSLDKATHRMETLLHLAVMANCLDCVRYLVDQDVNFNQKDENGNSCLHLAVAKGNRPVFTDKFPLYLYICAYSTSINQYKYSGKLMEYYFCFIFLHEAT
jgi:ankyrin repeat protein